MTSRKKIFLKGVILAITKFMINPKISVLLVTNANSVCALMLSLLQEKHSLDKKSGLEQRIEVLQSPCHDRATCIKDQKANNCLRGSGQDFCSRLFVLISLS